MAEQRYRFGGPIPESVLALQKRRRYRDSSLYAGVKKIRREKFWANPPAGWVTERDGMGFAVGIKRAPPVEPTEAGAVTYRFLEDATDRVLSDVSSGASPLQSAPRAEASPAPVAGSSSKQTPSFLGSGNS